MKKILILGENSYIGRAFAKYMERFSAEYEISCLSVRNRTPSPDMFCGYNAVFCTIGIAHIRETAENRPDYFRVNRDLVVDLARCARTAGIHQFILLSSMNVYGLSSGHISQSTVASPVSAYGESKLQADQILMTLSDKDFRIAILRPPMVYGKDCPGNYQRLRKLAIHFPFFPRVDNERSMIYIDNLCFFVKEILETEKSGIFFPQNQEYVCTSQLMKEIAQSNGKKMILIPGIGFLLKLLPLKIIHQVLGSLTYEKCHTVSAVSFAESIKQSESF